MKQLTAGSLFSGAGMMDYAFAQAGFDIRFQVEIDDYCRKVLAKHGPTYWPDAKVYSDVRDVTGQQLGYVDVVFGGFPCQDISKAGKRAGIQEGSRSGLWFEFARLIGDIRPRAVLLENVAAITRRDGIKVITGLTRLGYDARWGVISAADVGAPHLRERWWCVAFDVEHASDQRQKQQHNCMVSGHSGQHCGGFATPDVGHTTSQRCERRQPESVAEEQEGAAIDNRFGKDGFERRWPPDQPRLDRSIDGPSVRMDRHHGLIVKHQWPAAQNEKPLNNEPPRMALGTTNTRKRLEVLGNGALPQIVYPIALYLKGMLLAADRA